jgi:outer membrane protein insertion porin family
MGRRAVGVLLALALSSAARGGPAAAIPEDLIGRTIESVAFTSDGPVERREIESLISLEVGRPLTDDATAATIRNLFGTLQFSNVLIEAEPSAGGGVAVTVHLWRAFRVRTIRFEGKSSLSSEELRRAVPFAEGDPFAAAPLAAGASSIERRLVTEGYLHPAVDPDASFDREAFAVTVVYHLAAGQRARVAAPFFDGDTKPFAPELLARRGKIREGKPYRESQARVAAERMRKFLLEQGYFRANVELIAAEPTETGTIRPVYRIAVGSHYEIQSAGIKPKQARREILALLAGQSFDEDLLALWVDNRKEELQRAGHYHAKVTAATSQGADSVAIAISVEPGPKYAVERISFSGNASVDATTLQELMVTRKKGLPVVQKGRLIDTNLEGDASAILGYYQTHGWIDARVERPVITDGSKPGLLDVGIKVVEGPRTYVSERRIEGAEHLSPEEIDRLVTIRVGQPLNPTALRLDVGALTTHYWNTGWREASVQDGTQISVDRTKADVLYRVAEGTRTFFGKTIIRGNAVTDPARIQRNVAWKEGQPFSQEKVADTQQNLARTGAFRSIEIHPQPADPETQARDVDIQVSEARRLSLLYGFGYQNSPGATMNRNDVFAVAGATYRNLFGSMRTASLEVQYAPISQRGHIFANFVEPYLFNTNVPLTFVAFASREPIQDIDIDRVGGYLESVRLFGQHLRAGVRYEYQQIAPRNPEDLSTIELEQFPKSDLPIKESTIGPSFLYDRRDDILDPHRGYYWTFAGKYAFPFLSAEARYGKVSAQGAWFTRLLGGVLGASARVGAIFPYGPPTETGVPIAERFFSGGSATGRGFDTDLLGIPGVTVDYNTQATPHTGTGLGSCASTFPDLAQYDCNTGPRIIGGNGFMAWTLEYRVPILGNLGMSVFYDLAQVWANAGDIRVAIEGTSGMRQSIGAGVHYLTPIGPLRLEYGMPVERRTITYEVTTTDPVCPDPPCTLKSGLTTKETGRVFLSIGYPF